MVFRRGVIVAQQRRPLAVRELVVPTSAGS